MVQIIFNNESSIRKSFKLTKRKEHCCFYIGKNLRISVLIWNLVHINVEWNQSINQRNICTSHCWESSLLSQWEGLCCKSEICEILNIILNNEICFLIFFCNNLALLYSSIRLGLHWAVNSVYLRLNVLFTAVCFPWKTTCSKRHVCL